MQAVKWCGYIVAAIIVLTIVLSLGLAVIALVAVASAVMIIGGVVFLTAAWIKSAWEGIR